MKRNTSPQQRQRNGSGHEHLRQAALSFTSAVLSELGVSRSDEEVMNVLERLLPVRHKRRKRRGSR